MKKILLVLFALLFSINAKSSHVIGGSITVQYAGSTNTYIVKAYFYRNCGSIPGPTLLDISYSDIAQSPLVSYSRSLPILSQNPLPFFTCGNLNLLPCISGFGVEEYIYQDTVVLPNASTSWRFWTTNCCRYGAANLTYPYSLNFFVDAELDNLNYPTNSLPDFNTAVSPIFCLNQQAIFSNTAVDIDGDSIVYKLNVSNENVTTYYSPGVIPYEFPYTANQFVSSSAPITFDSTTGIVSFTPNLQQYVTCVIVAEEYRNGVKVGSSKRDWDVIIINGTNLPSLITGTVFLDQNNDGIKNNGEPGLRNVFVKSSPFYSYSLSDSSGDYSMVIGTGPHSIELNPLPGWFTINPTAHNFNFNVAGNVANGTDFAITATPGTTDLELGMFLAPVRPYVNTNANLFVKNWGSDVSGGTLILTLPDSVDFNSASITPISILGNIVTWNLPSLGPLESISINLSLLGDSMLVFGDSVFFQVNVIATPGNDINILNNSMEGWINVINSYDPNIKTVYPRNTIPLTAVLAGKELIYRIDFENLGNGNALTVRITDVLPPEVMLESIEILNASHAFSFQMVYPRQLEFTFNNINLTSYYVDPINSKGYLIFRVIPRSNLSVGTIISNEANIYFDNNAPVLTPMTDLLVIGTTSISEYAQLTNNSIFVYPNPTQDIFNFEIPNAEIGEFAVSLYSIDGKLINALSIQKQKEQTMQLDLSNTEKGIYIVIVSKGKSVWSSRVVRN